MAKRTEVYFECDLCGERTDHYSTIAFSFCGCFPKREICKPCRRSFDDWRESRKPKPKEASRDK